MSRRHARLVVRRTGTTGRGERAALVRRWIVIVGIWLLAPAGAVHAQRTSYVGVATTAGRVAYIGGRSSAGWTLGVSARRRLWDGRWDSFAVDVLRAMGSAHGGALVTTAFGRYDRLRSTRAAMVGVEVAWRPSGSLTIAGRSSAIVDAPGCGTGRPRFHGAAVGLRVSPRADLALTVLIRYEAGSRRLRSDLGVHVLP